jgi:hypothetical protein
MGDSLANGLGGRGPLDGNVRTKRGAQLLGR